MEVRLLLQHFDDALRARLSMVIMTNTIATIIRLINICIA